MQRSQEAGQFVWYSHLFKNFPQFVAIHTVKVFGIVIKAEVDIFLELSLFFDDPTWGLQTFKNINVLINIFHLSSDLQKETVN